ncbi:MAG: hypothetical protein HQ503_14385, partial [Rhodospirillales bacterium]|nr:hypothetical protein [Rhodospirillales bacterium]
MMYVIATIVPPAAIFMAGRVFSGILSTIIWGLSILIFVFSLGFGSFLSGPLWVIAVLHALYIT